jgi:hypothetical protein
MPAASGSKQWPCRAEIGAGGGPLREAGTRSYTPPDGQSVDDQVRQLTKAGCRKVFRETASGAKSDRAQASPRAGWRARLVILLNTLAAIADKKAGFLSLGAVTPASRCGRLPADRADS